MKKVEWLPHLENSVPDSISGYSTGFYSIALEAWRRGLSIEFEYEKRVQAITLLKISSAKEVHHFRGSQGSLVTNEASRICRNKHHTKEYLIQNKVPTPKGRVFTKEDKESSLFRYAKRKYPVVLKPTNGLGGKGVITNIKNKKELKNAITIVRDELGYQDVIIEEYFEGEDYRVIVIGSEVVAITKRIPANITGDGKSTVSKLIKEENMSRKQSPILGASLIKKDEDVKEMLKEQRHDYNSIPKKGEIVYLKSVNNISAGGDPVDITDEVSPEIKQIAIDGVNAIPGLAHAGVDLMVNREKNKAVILEINSRPSIRAQLYPMKGKARDVPKALIDYYFPETINQAYNTHFYFDFSPAWELFRSGVAKTFSISPLPEGETEITRFVVDGVMDKSAYGRWVRRQARRYDVHGYFKSLKDDKASVVIGGARENVEKFRKVIKNETPTSIHTITVVEKKRTTPVQIGFEVHKDTSNAGQKKDISKSSLQDNNLMYTPKRLEGLFKMKVK